MDIDKLHAQSQESLRDQLKKLVIAANRMGLYDGTDAIVRLLEGRKMKTTKPEFEEMLGGCK